MKKAGIYKIINKINNKYYIGSTTNIKQRYADHRSQLNRNKHHCSHLQNAWLKYGQDNFYIITVEELEPIRQILIKTEQQYLNDIKNNDAINCYNHCFIAGGGNYGEETNKKIREKRKLQICTDETKRRMSLAHKDRVYRKGYKLSPEICKKISRGHIGLKKSEETCRRLSIALKGKKKTKQHCDNLSKALLGKKHSIETCKAISKRLLGNTHTRDKTIYSFKNKITGEIFTGVKCEFYRKYNLDKGSICHLVKGERKMKHYKNWILI